MLEQIALVLGVINFFILFMVTYEIIVFRKKLIQVILVCNYLTLLNSEEGEALMEFEIPLEEEEDDD